MILDSQALEDGATLTCDVCIMGSGAAGMTVACELDGAGLDVLLLEAGGSKYDSAQQQALRGEVGEGSPHSPPDMYRRRMLGGATTIWGGRCVPLSPIDLQQRDHVPHSGWPMTWPELERHYPKAQEYCEAGDYAYTVAEALGQAAPPTIAGFVSGDVDATEIERFSPPTDFGKRYLDRLAKSQNIRVMLRTRALRLREQDGTIDTMEAAAPGRKLTVKARHYVLATGGLETPRLLMNSDGTRRGGLGNQSGALGRFYMCHVENTLGLLRLQPSTRAATVHFERTPDGIYARRKFTLTPAAQQREGLLNCAARLHYPLIADPSHRNGVLSAMYLVKDMIIPEYRRKLATIELANRDLLSRDARFWASHMANIGIDSLGVARFGVDWMRRRILARRKLPFVAFESRDGSYPLDVNAEQIPDEVNAVTLTDTPDADGLRQIKVHWRLAGQDVDSLLRTMHVMRQAFAQSGCAMLELGDGIEDQIRASTPVGGHHIGTARMADSPSQGVVDRHCRVHGLDNLHLAGAAVFPTCGHANPTLTIVALSVRLAERLKQVIRPAATPERIAQAGFAQAGFAQAGFT